MKRNLARKPSRVADTATESLGLNPGSGVETSTTGNGQNLADLVWKYFGELISETLMEVQETLAAE
jgi:hypothetical protein